MGRPITKSETILDGAVRLYQNKQEVWQCAFTVQKQQVRQSTRSKDFIEAKAFATDLYLTAKFREKEGLPAVTRQFKSIALATRDAMQKKLIDGVGKVSYQDNIEIIDKWLIPFFGNKPITSIGGDELCAFAEWRAKELGRDPAHNTVNKHNVALNKVFDLAVDKGYMKRSDVPDLQNDGKKGERRPDLTLTEYRTLCRKMWRWVDAGRAGKSRDKRHLLRDYVLILANTGMRTGTEANGIKWKHIRLFTKDGVEYLAIWVSGKTGSRELVARHGTIRYLKRIQSRNPVLAAHSFEDLLKLKLDIPLFALPDGTPMPHMAKTFRIMMEDVGLLIDPRTGQERTLYSLRHFYATMSLLIRNTPIAILARQMGTSMAMIDKHYSHIVAVLAAEQLAG